MENWFSPLFGFAPLSAPFAPPSAPFAPFYGKITKSFIIIDYSESILYTILVYTKKKNARTNQRNVEEKNRRATYECHARARAREPRNASISANKKITSVYSML